MTTPPINQHVPPRTGKTTSWLLTCHRCGNMVEVPDTTTGIIYTCGICHTAMAVVDGERGITCEPPPAATPCPPTPPVKPPPSPPADALLPGFDVIATLDADVHGRRFRVRGPDGRSFRALVINPALAAEAAFAERIDPHLAALRQLHCPYIVPIDRIVRTGGTVVYLSYDPPGFEPLSAVLLRDPILAQHVALTIIRQLASALDEAVSQGLSHGWLRPEVVLLNADGVVLLDELGVPKSHAFLLRNLKSLIGNGDYYLAPDHLDQGRASDAKADIFMLGALFFRMLTGEALVVGPTAYSALSLITAQGIPSLGSRKPGIHANIDMLFTYLAAVDRRERFNRLFEIVDRCKNLDGSTKRFPRDGRDNGTAGIRPPRTPMAGYSLGAIEANRPGTRETVRVGTNEITRVGSRELPRIGTEELTRTGTREYRPPGTAAIARPGTTPLQRPDGTARIQRPGPPARIVPVDVRPAPPPPPARLRKTQPLRARGRHAPSHTGLTVIAILLIIATAAVAWYVVKTLGEGR